MVGEQRAHRHRDSWRDGGAGVVVKVNLGVIRHREPLSAEPRNDNGALWTGRW